MPTIILLLLISHLLPCTFLEDGRLLSEKVKNKVTAKYKEVPSRLRRLTIKEAALIQTFPDDYIFCGSKTSIYKQIGNAVPCKLAEVVASAVIEMLSKSEVNHEKKQQLSLFSM